MDIFEKVYTGFLYYFKSFYIISRVHLFILAEMYRRSGGTDTAVPVEVYRQTGTGYRLHHSG